MDDFNKYKYQNELKTVGVYMSILDLPYYNQSSRDELMVLLMFKREIIKQALRPESALNEVFRCLIDDLRLLKVNGIKLSNGVRLVVNLAQVTGDNLATNEMLRLPRNFTLDSCKYCKLFHSDLQSSTCLGDIVMNREMRGDHLFAPIVNQPYLYCPDPMHDFFEGGIVSKVLNPLLSIYYQKPSQLLEKINFKNGPIKINKKNDTFQISGKGIQIVEFFYSFSFLDDQIARNSEHWRVYLLLRSIVNFFTATEIQRDSVEASRALVYEFLNLYYKLFVETKLETATFKLHHLCHYPDLVLIFGPLFFCSNWRYERFHQSHVQLVCSRSGINAESTMARAFLQKFNLNLDQDQLTYSKADLTPAIKQTYRRFSGFVNLEEGFKVVKSATIRKVIFEPGCAFVKLAADNPLFCKIEIIFEQNSRLVVICKQFQTIRYCRKLASYVVHLTENLTTIDPYDLVYYRSLPIHNNLINKDFHLVNQNVLGFH